MCPLTEAQKIDLEGLIDASSLKAVAEALTEICEGKAEPIPTNWQDRAIAKVWDHAAQPFRAIASRLEV